MKKAVIVQYEYEYKVEGYTYSIMSYRDFDSIDKLIDYIVSKIDLVAFETDRIAFYGEKDCSSTANSYGLFFAIEAEKSDWLFNEDEVERGYERNFDAKVKKMLEGKIN